MSMITSLRYCLLQIVQQRPLKANLKHAVRNFIVFYMRTIINFKSDNRVLPIIDTLRYLACCGNLL